MPGTKYRLPFQVDKNRIRNSKGGKEIVPGGSLSLREIKDSTPTRKPRLTKPGFSLGTHHDTRREGHVVPTFNNVKSILSVSGLIL